MTSPRLRRGYILWLEYSNEDGTDDLTRLPFWAVIEFANAATNTGTLVGNKRRNRITSIRAGH